MDYDKVSRMATARRLARLENLVTQIYICVGVLTLAVIILVLNQ